MRARDLPTPRRLGYKVTMRPAYLLLSVVMLAACPSSSPPAASPGAPDGERPAPAPTVVTGPSPDEATEPPVEVPPGAAVSAPVFSDDDCAADNDCTGVRTCHPAKCVAVANAGQMPPGMMCTMECRGGTLDCNFNHCGCAANPAGKKKCAMLPGPAPNP